MLLGHDPKRIVKASWASEKAPEYEVTLRIKRIARVGILRDVSNVFADAHLAILDFHSLKPEGLFYVTFSLDSWDTLEQIIGRLEAIPGVFEVKEVQD